jgi:hypothetical protein
MFTVTELTVSSVSVGAATLHKAIVVIAFTCPVTAPAIGAPVVELVNTRSGTVTVVAVTNVLLIIFYLLKNHAKN